MSSEYKKLRQIVREEVEFVLENKKPSYGYHVSPSSRSDRIRDQGIKPRSTWSNEKDDPVSNRTYFWRDLDTAKWFVDFKKHSEERSRKKFDIWKVNLDGLDIKRDPQAKDMSRWSTRFSGEDKGHAWYYSGSISPERIVGRVN